MSAGAVKHPRRRRVLRWALWLLLVLLGVPLLYAGAALGLALIPVNGSFVNATEGIEVDLVSNGIHVDFVVPAVTPVRDWTRLLPRSQFPGVGSSWSHLALGWGDRGFYLETPTWSDLKLSTAVKAIFWPTPSVVHAQYLPGPLAAQPSVRKLRLTNAAYETLCSALESSFRKGPGREAILIPNRGYGLDDNFYEGEGSYHAFNTCNLWANSCLKTAGVKTALWSPFPGGLLRHLPE